MDKHLLRRKSFEISILITNLCIELRKRGTDYSTINQLRKSATSIGAMIREAEFAQSKADFTNKLSIAIKGSQ